MQIDTFKVKEFPAIDQIGMSTGREKLRVCIVTEEIIGPVRNGGIASTYYHLSKGLAAHGHEVHVLFLKGRVVQDETPEHWVEHFAAFGVTLHYLEAPKADLWGSSIEWQARFGAAYAWLRDNPPFDVVHTSEWRGGMIYALMAKRMGLAFQETLFLVKTSSPHIWNRHYQMQPIEQRELVLAAYAEQKCVELADAVIGGSAHLITFMEEIGYKVPDANVFVQPNIVDFSKVIVTDERPPRAPGDVVKTQELIFFGRLEARKGVEMMCNALDILKERGIAPSRMTFMGKWGAPLATQGGMRPQDYIEEKSKNWDFEVGIIDDKNQPAALSHMCSRDMIAVMPSLIENSTMAVYETLENNIPFIATAVGGTPELIDPKDHERSLVAPRAQDLANQLERALTEGQPIAHSSFSNDENLRVWYGFHAHVGDMVKAHGRRTAITDITAPVDPAPAPVRSISFATLMRRGDAISPLVNTLLADAPDQVVLGFTDAALREEVTEAAEQLAHAEVKVTVVDAIGQAAGDALNMLMEAQSCDAVVIGHGADISPLPGYFAAAKTALTHQPDILFTSFFDAGKGVMGMPIGGDVASQYMNTRAYGPEIFALRAATYDRLGAFEPYDVRAGILHEYVTRMVERGGSDLLVFPEMLLRWLGAATKAKAYADDTVYSYLKAKPLIDASSLAQRKITLATLNQGSAGALTPNMLRDGGRVDGESVWMMPVEWDRTYIGTARKRAMVIALDETINRLWLYARGDGDRVFKVRGDAEQTALVQTHKVTRKGQGTMGEDITLSYFDIPPSWDVGASYPIHWVLEDGSDTPRNQFLRITKLSEGVYALVARSAILAHDALPEIIARYVHPADANPDQGAAADSGVDIDTKTAKADMASDTAALAEALGTAPAKAPRKITKKYKPKDPLEAIIQEAEDNLAPLQDIDPDLDALMGISHNTNKRAYQRAEAVERSQALLAEHLLSPAITGSPRGALTVPPNRKWRSVNDITGWAWDRDTRDTTLHIAVLLDDLPIFMTPANVHMPLLGKRTPGLEHHGFRIPVLDDFLSTQSPLELMIWETQTLIKNSRLMCQTGPGGKAFLTLEKG